MRIPACSQVRRFGWLSVAAFALVVITSELAFFWTQPEMRDFGAFYESALSWRDTGLLYTGARSNPNLNPPHVSVLLFVPLLLWNSREGAQIWSAVQIAGFAAGLLLICREVRLSARRAAWVVAVFLGSAPVHHQFREGQVGGMLFLFATIAWWRARQGRPFAAWLRREPGRCRCCSQSFFSVRPLASSPMAASYHATSSRSAPYSSGSPGSAT